MRTSLSTLYGDLAPSYPNYCGIFPALTQFAGRRVGIVACFEARQMVKGKLSKIVRARSRLVDDDGEAEDDCTMAFESRLQIRQVGAAVQGVIHEHDLLTRLRLDERAEPIGFSGAFTLRPVDLSGLQRFADAVRHGQAAGCGSDNR